MLTLTPEQRKKGYFEAIQQYTNNFHGITEVEDAPMVIQMAVVKMDSFFSRDSSVKSESIADLSITYMDMDGLPHDILSLISPWCKVRF